LRRRDLRKTNVFRDVHVAELFDFRTGNLKSVLEQPVQQKAAAIPLRVGATEILKDRIYSLNLLEGVGGPVPDRHH